MVHHENPGEATPNKGVNGNWEREPKTNNGCFVKLVQFCKRTDLHGYKYVVMNELNLFERCCWALTVVVSTVFAVIFVRSAYQWYATNPIVTVIESTQGAIWDIPFPAITFCDLNYISRKSAREFSDNLTLPANMTADEVFETLRLVPLLHFSYELEEETRQALLKFQTVLDLNQISIETLFSTLSPVSPCSRFVQRCMWKNTIYRCEALFQQVFTLIHVCCSFNYLAVDSSLKKTSTSHEMLSKETPVRVASCGYQTALTVLLNNNLDDYYSSAAISRGIMVFIHNAYNIPDMDSRIRLVNPSTELMISLSPEHTYANPGVRAFHPKDRRCFYSDEVKLGNLRHYSFYNCIVYQKTKFVRDTCGCVPYFSPFQDYHRQCNFNDIDCLGTISDRETKKNIEQEMNIDESSQNYQCMPECEHYDYPIEVAYGKLSNELRLDGLTFFNGINLENRSLVNVFFNDLVSTRYRRDVYLNWQNLLASFGGLLSLMLGFTLIAGFDFLLFFTFGISCGSAGNQAKPSTKQSNTKKPKANKIYVQEYTKSHLFDTFAKGGRGKYQLESTFHRY